MKAYWTMALMVSACTNGWPGLTPGATESDAGNSTVDARDAGAVSGDGGPTSGYTWYRDVEPIFRSRCQQCHGFPPEFAARYPLVYWEDTQLPGPDGRRMYLHIAERLNGVGRVMPPPSQPQLTAEEHQIVMGWAMGGAPEGTPPEAEITWHRDIQPLIQTYCGNCHGEQPMFGAPFSLVRHSDMTSELNGVPLHQIVVYRMSGGGPNAAPMPPSTQPQPSREQIALVRAWSEAGAPAGALLPATWWQDVRPLFAERCFLCHNDPPANGAPWPFSSYAQATRLHPTLNVSMAQLILQRLQARTMPPISQPQLRLSEQQILVVQRWVNAGLPEGEPVALPDGGVDAGPPDSGPGIPWADGGSSPALPTGARWIETFAQNPINRGIYEVPNEDTSYICWSYLVGTSTNTPGQQYATYFEPIRDNGRFIHHVMLFVDRSGVNTSPDVAGPFDCLGFPSTADLSRQADFIAGWFPGRGPQQLPDGVGVELDPTDRLIVQVHYDSVSSEGTLDYSGFRSMIVSGRTLNGAAQLTHGSIWTTPLNGANESRTAECVVQQEFTAFSVVPHMHNLGTRIVFDVQRAGSTTWTTLVQVDPWSFDDMPIIDLPPNLQRFRPGDRLRTRCFWNTRGVTVRQGEASSDEMCFNFVYHYPPHPNSAVACAISGP